MKVHNLKPFTSNQRKKMLDEDSKPVYLAGVRYIIHKPNTWLSPNAKWCLSSLLWPRHENVPYCYPVNSPQSHDQTTGLTARFRIPGTGKKISNFFWLSHRLIMRLIAPPPFPGARDVISDHQTQIPKINSIYSQTSNHVLLYIRTFDLRTFF